jgi:hypothetical protein
MWDSPQYLSSVGDKVSALLQMVDTACQYAIINEYCCSDIASAIRIVYADCFNEDDDYPPLEDYIKALDLTGDDVWQYVQDLRNAIGAALRATESMG